MADQLKSHLVSGIAPAGSGNSGNILQGALAGFSQGTGSGGAIGQILGGFGTAIGGVAVGASMAMPGVAATISRSQGFYQAALGTGGGLNRTTIGNATFSAMRGGITSPGSDAMVGQGLASMGIMASTASNSTYMQMVRNVRNSAMYLGQDNATAMQAVAGLTTGSMSANLAATMGIYTSDPMTGKTRSESDIFGNIYAQFTAGQGRASVQDINDSFYKGNLGANLTNLGFSDAQKQRFLQFAINKAGGNTMDLSNNANAKALMGKNNKLGNSNPVQSTLDINTTMTDQMNAAAPSYEAGMKDAANLFQSMNSEVKGLITNFGQLNASMQTFLGTPTGAGLTQATTSIISGISSIGSGILGLIPKGGKSGGNGLATSSAAGAATTGMAATHVPANGPITAHLGDKGKMWSAHGHNGTDYGVPDGSPIYAAAAGVVRKDAVSQAANGGYGHYITIDHGDGYTTLYAHLDPSSADVHEGDQVQAGQVIGKSGHSGWVTGPHLHFEVQKDGQSIPIENFLSGAINTQTPSGNKAGAAAASSGLGFSFVSAMNAIGQSANELLGISAPKATKSVSSWSGPSSGAGVGQSMSAGTNPSGGLSNGIALGATTPAYSGGGVNVAPNVAINLHIAQASADEARKFAALVKGVLEGDKLAANMGAY
jgi:murein DD-endopeptidase MepM/ murein hydrolase activator NlpD